MTTLGGTPIAEVEALLSSALTASLCLPAEDRPAFIAQQLVGAGAAAPPPKPPSKKPPHLEDEIAELNEMVLNAVNCAARHEDQPLQRIADHLLRQGREKLGLQLAGDDEELALGRAEAEAAATAAAAASMAASSKPSASAINPVLQALQSRRRANNVPVMGKTTSTISQSVVGALQDEHAKKVAKTIDEDVIREAMAAGEKAMAAGAGLQQE